MFKGDDYDEMKNDHKLVSWGLRVLALVTGVLIYLIFHMVTAPKYLNPDSVNFQEDISTLTAVAVTLIVISIVWLSVYFQFKKDKTELGFPFERSGGSVLAEILIEMAIGPIALIIF